MHYFTLLLVFTDTLKHKTLFLWHLYSRGVLLAFRRLLSVYLRSFASYPILSFSMLYLYLYFNLFLFCLLCMYYIESTETEGTLVGTLLSFCSHSGSCEQTSPCLVCLQQSSSVKYYPGQG